MCFVLCVLFVAKAFDTVNHNTAITQNEVIESIVITSRNQSLPLLKLFSAVLCPIQ